MKLIKGGSEKEVKSMNVYVYFVIIWYW